MDFTSVVPYIPAIIFLVLGYYYYQKSRSSEKNVLLLLGLYKADNEMLMMALHRNMETVADLQQSLHPPEQPPSTKDSSRLYIG